MYDNISEHACISNKKLTYVLYLTKQSFLICHKIDIQPLYMPSFHLLQGVSCIVGELYCVAGT